MNSTSDRSPSPSPRRPRTGWAIAALALGLAPVWAASVQGGAAGANKPAGSAVLSAGASAFLTKHCTACHNAKNASGKLNLALPFRPADPENFAVWVKVHDRVQDGEMPPKGSPQPPAPARTAFLAALKEPLLAANGQRVRAEGRSTWRRLNRYEYENTVRDLLDTPWLQLRDMLPEDGLLARFNKAGDALDISHVQMSRYLAAAGYALRETLAKSAERPDPAVRRFHVRDQRSFGPRPGQAPERATFQIIDNQADLAALESGGRRGLGGFGAPVTPAPPVDPKLRDRQSVGMVASSYEPLTPRFDQFRATVSGRYKLRLRAHTFWAQPDNPERWWRPSLRLVSAGRTQEPVTLYASQPQGVTSVLRKLGTVDFGPELGVQEIEAYLLEGDGVTPDPARLFRSRPPNWHNPLATPEGQPGVAFQWLEVEGPLHDAWPPRGHQLIAGDVPSKITLIQPMVPMDTEQRPGRPFRQPDPIVKVELTPKEEQRDSERLIRNFVQHAYRRPVQTGDIQPFLQLFKTARGKGVDFTEALLAAYTGVLCSPGFLTLEERPGLLPDHALACRLSYFLWNSMPDRELRALADRGQLKDPKVLAAQVDRLLADPRSQRFTQAFLDYWLDLRKADITNPDEVLYPDYYLDDLLTESAIDETRAFLEEMIRGDLPARNLVASDFVMINERLAQLYQIPGVTGSQVRRVALPKDSVRGGLLTQASVLKVTANGTTTSPVLRGVWITERILGQPVPPPPAAVPAVEPDIRGATTIREQLAKHRDQEACRSCHARIDPPGFALESFDIFGGWREKYRALSDGPRVPGWGKNGQPFTFAATQPVDASGELLDGRKFRDVRELKQLLLQDERQIARNFVRQLVTYSTGAPVGFGDRAVVEGILTRARSGGYGVKSLIHQVVASELFRSK